MISYADGVQQSLEVERESFQIGHAEVVGHGAKSENKVVIGNLLAAVFTRTGRTWRQAYAVRRKIYSGDPCTDEPCAVQAAAQRRGDVAGLKAAARDLGEHRSEEERVCLADQRDGRRTAKLFLEILSHPHTGESPAQYGDPLLLTLGGWRGDGLGTDHPFASAIQCLCGQA